MAFFCAYPVAAQVESQPGALDAPTETPVQPDARTIIPPRLLHGAEPVYPPHALKEGQESTVVLKITVDAQGGVEQVEVETSGGEEFDRAAVEAARKFVFEPARVDGEAVPSQLLFRQRFVPLPPPPPPAPPVPPSVPEAPAPEPEKPVNFRGIVREAGTKDALAAAEVSVHLDSGEVLITETDAGGHFELRGVPPGTAMVHIAHTGHERLTSEEEFTTDDILQARYFLPRRTYNKFETVVVDRSQQREVTRVSVSRDEVNRVPGTFGDPLRAIENLPGMAQGPLLGGQLLVRGTPPRSSAVYLDGVQIPQLYHFGLLRSVIHPEFLQSIDIYPGGVGPQFGRATAGVVDVKSRKLGLTGYHAQFDLNPLEAAFFFAGAAAIDGSEATVAPNPKQLKFAFAGRRTYADAFIPLVANVVTPGALGSTVFAPLYWDYQAKVEYRPVAAHTFSLLAFGSNDEVRFALLVPQIINANIRFQLTFHRVIGKWAWLIGPRTRNEFQVSLGQDSAFLGLRAEALEDAAHNYLRAGINNTGPILSVREELRHDVGEQVTLVAGLDGVVGLPRLVLQSKQVSPTREFPPLDNDAPPESTGLVIRETQLVNTEDRLKLGVAPYVQAILQPIPHLQLMSGFRIDLMQYRPADRVLAPSPRLAFQYEPLPGTILKGATGAYVQAPRLYETSTLYGNPSLLPERSWQNTLGFEQRLTPRITVGVNGYVNFRRDLVQSFAVPINVDVDLGLPLFQTSFDNGSEGRVVGMDFLLRHEITSSFYGWIAYTLSKSEVRRTGEEHWRPFNFDQRHILTMVGQYRVPWHLPFREWSRTGRLPNTWFTRPVWSFFSGDLSLSARFRYVTGNPADYLRAGLALPGPDGTPERLPPFSGRLKPFHQLDVRVDYKMSFDLMLVTFSLDVINLTNASSDKRDLPQVPMLPLAAITVEL